MPSRPCWPPASSPTRRVSAFWRPRPRPMTGRSISHASPRSGAPAASSARRCLTISRRRFARDMPHGQLIFAPAFAERLRASSPGVAPGHGGGNSGWPPGAGAVGLAGLHRHHGAGARHHRSGAGAARFLRPPRLRAHRRRGGQPWPMVGLNTQAALRFRAAWRAASARPRSGPRARGGGGNAHACPCAHRRSCWPRNRECRS